MIEKLYNIILGIIIITLIIIVYFDVIKVGEETNTKIETTQNNVDLEVLTTLNYDVIVVEPMTEEQLAEEEYYDSLETLAICVEAEAGNQDLMGKKLVADVILNRVDSDKFPNDINSVISDKNQFSSYTDGGMDKVYEPSEETFEAIREELDSRTDSSILYFTAGGYNKYCRPAYKYGAHYFGY